MPSQQNNVNSSFLKNVYFLSIIDWHQTEYNCLWNKSNIEISKATLFVKMQTDKDFSNFVNFFTSMIFCFYVYNIYFPEHL